ncbi:DUF1254 domain-containing protein [Cupriavidus sp. CP313]
MEPHDNNVATRACDAVRYTLPLHEMARMRAATCPRRDSAGVFAGDGPDSTLRWINTITHVRTLLGPQHRQVVTPNNDTLYTNAWLDLSNGPLLLDVPDCHGRYYVLGLLDAYTNPFGYIGTRTTGTQGGTWLLHGPAWRGEVPAGATPLPCPTNAVWIIGRILADGEADLPGAHALQDGIRLRRPDGTSAASVFDAGMRAGERPTDPDRYAAIVGRMLRDNPPPAGETELAATFARAGIGSNAPVTEAQRAALATALAQVDAELAAPKASALGGGWSLSVEIRTSFGTHYALRAGVARNYIGALGVEEAMYLMADCDGDGQPLDGTHQYELVFPPQGLPQVGAFWSLTMYRKSDCMLAENALQRYSLGDRSPGLRAAPDGSLRIVLGAQAPADSALAGNWLPAPAEPFYVALRLYVPGAPHLERTFRYPPIRRVKAAI